MEQSTRLKSKTLYEVLGVMPDASTDEIRTQYKELARLYHPDSNFYSDIVDTSLSSEQIELFKVITAAYQTLIDPNKRATYDSAIRPLIDGNIPNWESRNDFWDGGSKVSQTSVRRRTMTFGQTSKPVTMTQPIRTSAPEQPIAKKDPPRKKKSQKRERNMPVILMLGFVIGLLMATVVVIGMPRQEVEETTPQVVTGW